MNVILNNTIALILLHSRQKCANNTHIITIWIEQQLAVTRNFLLIFDRSNWDLDMGCIWIAYKIS